MDQGWGEVRDLGGMEGGWFWSVILMMSLSMFSRDLWAVL
jgi:hypothetical protein